MKSIRLFLTLAASLALVTPGFTACSNTGGGGEQCTNGIDDDGDGATDCQDPDCSSSPACMALSEICNNGADDDGDGMVDCNDDNVDTFPGQTMWF